MDILEKRITDFIKEHHILTLATSNENKPYCCTCFYAYMKELNMFVITSDKETKHILDAIKQNNIAGSIALETKTIGKIRGIQFTGIIEELKGSDLKSAKLAYLKSFPFAILKLTTIWGIKPEFIKMTDNRLGFGKKIIWTK